MVNHTIKVKIETLDRIYFYLCTLITSETCFGYHPNAIAVVDASIMPVNSRKFIVYSR